jgi:glycerophosphoryl diester phosphodiesterase
MHTGPRYRYLICPRLPLVLTAAVLFSCALVCPARATEIVAHRGGYFLAPENTCAAFQACAGRVDRIEFDVHLAADGELVVIHDDTVNRTTTGYGAETNVAALTLAQLKELDAGSKFSPLFAGERIPTLAEALRALPAGIPAMIHHKTGNPETYLAVLQAENAISNTIVYSDNWNFLFALHPLEPRLELCAGGYTDIGPIALGVLKSGGVSSVGLLPRDATPAVVERIRSFGLQIHVATEGPQALPFLDMGVDRLLVASPWLGRALIDTATARPAQLSRALVAYWKFDDGLENPLTTICEDVEATSPGQLFGFTSPPAWLMGPRPTPAAHSGSTASTTMCAFPPIPRSTSAPTPSPSPCG